MPKTVWFTDTIRHIGQSVATGIVQSIRATASGEPDDYQKGFLDGVHICARTMLGAFGIRYQVPAIGQEDVSTEVVDFLGRQ